MVVDVNGFLWCFGCFDEVFYINVVIYDWRNLVIFEGIRRICVISWDVSCLKLCE